MTELEEALLDLIGHPDPGHGNWPDFLETLRAIQARVSQITATQGSAWLNKAIENLVGSLEKQNLPPARGVLVRGVIGEYPVFAALAIQPAPGLEGVARALQAQFLAGMAARRKFKETDGSHQYIINAGLGVRKFARHDFERDSEVALLAEARNSNELHRAVERLLHESDADSQEKSDTQFRAALEYLSPFAKYTRKGQAAPTKSQSESSERTPQIRVSAELEHDVEAGEDASLGLRPPRISSRGLSTAQQKRYQSEASSPNVETSRDVLFQSEVAEKFPNGKTKQLTERQVTARARTKAAAVKRSLQPTASKRSTLHFPALKVLAQITFDPNAPDEERMADILIAMMFLTGCRPEDVHGFRIWRADKPDYPANVFAIIIATKEFRVPIRPLDQAWKPSRDEEEYYRPVESYLRVRIPTHLPVGQAILDFADLRMSGEVAFEWPSDPKELRHMVANRLSAFSESGHMYLYPDRVSQYLGKAIYSLEGDMADANLITGARADKDDSRSYYHGPPISHLQRCYETVWRLISSRLDGSPERRPARLGLPMNNEGPYVGSAGVPRSDRVRTLFSDLYRIIDQRSRGVRTADWWRDRHNSITAALYMLVLWMTGIRPARDVLEYGQYDAVTGLLAVNDKDNEENSKVRLVWLLPALQQQLKQYELHLQRVAKHLDFDDPNDLAFRFLSSKNRIIKYSKKTWEANLGVAYPFRENAHRHYIRTRLRELGVDGAYVDALLGHGGVGREAYGNYSALTPFAMRDAIQEPLNAIWRELGFGPVI